MSLRSWALPAVVAVLALTSAREPACAASPNWQDALTGRLQRIKETRTVRLGFRENAIPFSYLGPDGRPVGYSLDICEQIVAMIATELGIVGPDLQYVRVSAQDRIERVEAGTVDLECGSTTNTTERRQRVAFSPVIFVTGTRLAVPRGSAIRDVDDLAGRRVAVVSGTTNEAAMREVDRLRGLRMTLVAAAEYREALTMLTSGKAEALAADDALLRGLLAETGRTSDFRLVGDLLSFEPYGIMYPRGDPPLADAVDRALRMLAETREIVWIYNRWFMRPLPSRGTIALPMSVQLRRSLELIGLPAD